MNSPLKQDTLKAQQQLATYCRDGIPVEIPGASASRLKHYRRLVYNVVRDALSSTYPLTVNLLTEKEWETVCYRFFKDHRCEHSQVWRMPFELIAFVDTSFEDLKSKYPHLIELMEFEWKEVEYYMMPDIASSGEITHDFWTESWNLNPELEVLALSYPVHTKNARFISISDKGAYYCLIFRHPESGKVRFIQLSAFYAGILSEMKTASIKLCDWFASLPNQAELSEEEIKQSITPFFEKLKSEGAIF